MLSSWFISWRVQASFARGNAALARGDSDLALSWFSHAVQLDPTSALGHLGCGLAHLRKCDFDTAIASLSDAIRLSGDPRAYFLRSLCYEGKADRCRELADRHEALRREPRVKEMLNYCA